MISMYIDNFILVSNNASTLNKLKIELVKKYKVKDLRKVKTIIS